MKRQRFAYFFFVICVYHLIHTFFGYQLEILSPHLLSGIKDVRWLLLVLIIFFRKKTYLLAMLQQMKVIWGLLIILSIGSIVWSWYLGMSIGSIVVGFKYDIYPLVIAVTALSMGMILAQKRDMVVPPRLTLSSLTSILGRIMVGGLIRQGAKLLFPDLMMVRGYGPVGDYVLGSAPPLYYRTGPGGMMRLQGLFSGPNNYGFFLVAIGGIITSAVLSQKSGQRTRIWGLIYLFSLAWTLSRGARIGAAICIGLTIFFFFPKYKTWLGRGVALCLVAVLGMSRQKIGSTSGHRGGLVEGMQAFLMQPWGYGLGMAGPSVHFEGRYLPENQYLQILLDLGILGFLLWGTIRYTIVMRGWTARTSLIIPHQKQLLGVLWFGLIGLLIEGGVLHVWEDSMINYLFLGGYGVLLGFFIMQSGINTPSSGGKKSLD